MVDKYTKAKHFSYPSDMSNEEKALLKKTLEDFDLVLFNLYDSNYQTIEIYEILKELDVKLIISNFQPDKNLIDFMGIDAVDGLISVKGNSEKLRTYVAQMIFGAVKSSGKLLEDVGIFKEGEGWSLPGG